MSIGVPRSAALIFVCVAAMGCVRDDWKYPGLADAAPDAADATGASDTGACPAGRRALAGTCVVDARPRPLAPLSLGDVTQRRPTLRWSLPEGFDGAEVQLCRDRACATVIETLTVTGRAARPTADLPPRSVVYWRVRGRVGVTADDAYGPTWLFHVPAVSAASGVDTSFNPHLDVNGDGFDDLLVGAYQADPLGRNDAGAASVFHGGPSGVSSAPAAVMTGEDADDNLGWSVSGAGDVNGDGYADVIVGAHRADPEGRGEAGTASVFYGGPAGLAIATAVALAGAAPGDHFGYAVAGAGDLDGDGYADVAVGTFGSRPGGRHNAGTASVFRGGPAGVSTTASAVFEGAAVDDQLGFSLASGGDLNGDGYSDLAVGVVFASPGGRYRAGEVQVYYGGAAGVATSPARLAGVGAVDLFGVWVASAGDVNADGYADLVVGASGTEALPRHDVGAAHVFHGGPLGVSAVADRVILGLGDTDQLGAWASGAGDTDGDGYADLVVGAIRADPGGRPDAGTASVHRGGPTGVSADPSAVLEGPTAGERFGCSVRGVGDLNGDGYADVAVGSVMGNSVWVFHGSAAGVPMTPTRSLTGASADDRFGLSVAWADGPQRGPGSSSRAIARGRVLRHREPWGTTIRPRTTERSG